MKTLSEINKDVTEYRKEILELAKNINPKLLSELKLEDAKNDHTLYDNELKENFEELERKAIRYNSIIYAEAKEYFTDLCNDLKNNGVDIGNNIDGEPLESYFGNLVLDFDNFQPSFQVDAMYDVVRKYQESIKVVPFWKKSINMYVPEHNIYVNVSPGSSPEKYIQSMIEASKNNLLSPNEVFLECVKAEMKSSYKMHTTIKSASNITEPKYVKSYTESVLMHLALEELLKRAPNKEYIINGLVRSDDDFIIEIKEK